MRLLSDINSQHIQEICEVVGVCYHQLKNKVIDVLNRSKATTAEYQYFSTAQMKNVKRIKNVDKNNQVCAFRRGKRSKK
jgi:hypothetical protein